MESEIQSYGGRADSSALVAAAAVGIVSMDPTATILGANEAALAMLDCSEDELVGLGAHEALNRERPSTECELEAAVRTGWATHDENDTFTTGRGAQVPVWWAVNPLRDRGSGDLLGAVLVFGGNANQRAQAAADAAETARRRADLAEAQQNIADLEWVAAVSQALSSTLDEVEVLQRLARLAVGRFADLAVAHIIDDAGVVRRAGGAVADGIDIDLADVLHQPNVDVPFDEHSATSSIITASEATLIDRAKMAEPGYLSPQSLALLVAVDAAYVLSVPLIARGQVVGALGLIRLRDDDPFDKVDTLAATDVCLRAALALDNARLFRGQTDISKRLQAALLPALPARTIVRPAVRYLPARDRFDVGGDWYDLFHPPNDHYTVLLVVGDVAGHDLAAGTTMSALRNLLRGVSVATQRSPAQVLYSVDSSLDALGITGTATVQFVELTNRRDPATGARTWLMRWSNAGHMPVLLFTPDGQTEMLDEVHGPLLGTSLAMPRSQSERVIPAGSTLVLYTDGLVETRSESIDAGLTRLRRAAVSLNAPIDDPDAVADELIARNHTSVEDDTAMLVCHLPEIRD